MIIMNQLNHTSNASATDDLELHLQRTFNTMHEDFLKWAGERIMHESYLQLQSEYCIIVCDNLVQKGSLVKL